MKQPLVEGIDFYYNEQGYVVLTEVFHIKRGHCCGNGCKHCPYAYENVTSPKKEALLARRRQNEE
ncbi:hypothetical protein GO495_26295 [Chitinophaga oryziterrae]|uniref:Uncharacterized protein n=1 Tax=Chitinophaga oryziterrae TaxID=1031224 RepID=A0A6N8JFT5_9BACT|nr:DUF5522 domain-containing protein [Chitinophaga oryziterrae]MVT44133.1 hypothetical protein [Chitinophaga oryziterrae]